jgi:hypothetical protein
MLKKDGKPALKVVAFCIARGTRLRAQSWPARFIALGIACIKRADTYPRVPSAIRDADRRGVLDCERAALELRTRLEYLLLYHNGAESRWSSCLRAPRTGSVAVPRSKSGGRSDIRSLFRPTEIGLRRGRME